MLKSLIVATAAIAAAGPAAAFGDFYQTEAGSNIAGNYSPFAFAPATYTLPGVTISNVATPVPTVRISAANRCCGDTGGIGQWGYGFSIAGPDYNAVVPILAHVVAHGTARATTNGSAIAAAQLTILPDNELSERIIVTGQASVSRYATPDSGPFAIDRTVAFDVTAGYGGYLQGYAAAVVDTFAYYNDGMHLIRGTGSASVYLDPYLSIDPTWAAANPGYSLVVDSGYGNAVGGVPEPAAWALLAAGFGGVGALARRRRAVVAA